MIPSTELENGKVELIREILDISDIHDIDLLKEYNKELADSLTQELTPDAFWALKDRLSCRTRAGSYPQTR